MIRSHARCRALALACFVVSVPALARPAPPTSEARERFERAIRLFNGGDKAGAAAELRRSFELSPSPKTLYNLGLVQADMGRAVEAVDALDRVLAAPGDLPSERVDRARAVRDEQAKRIATIVVTTSVPGAFVDVDTVEAGKTPFAAPLRVVAGTHTLGAALAGYVPTRKRVTIAGGETTTVDFTLVALEARLAHLAVKTALPAAEVVIDGEVVGESPLAASLTLLPGAHRVEVRRAGYRAPAQSITLGDGATGELTFAPDVDDAALASDGGTLSLSASESDAVFSVDGVSRGVVSSVTLPPGPHHLKIERGGFFAQERDVVIPRRGTLEASFTLEPKPETRAAFVLRARSQRTWGWVATVGGAVLAGGGVALLVDRSRHKSTTDDLDAAHQATLVPGGACDSKSPTLDSQACASQASVIDQRRSTESTLGALGFGALGVGAAALGTGVVLLVTSDDPHRYDTPAGSPFLGRLVPGASVDAHGGWVSLRGVW